MAVVLVVAQTLEVGGLTGLLQVGESNPLRGFIETELGEVPLAPGRGHDGQMFYAIGVDPLGGEIEGLLDHPGYRLRRILYPVVASLFGLLDGHALLLSMIVIVVLAVAVSAGSAAYLAARGGRTEWLALAVVLNPGVWLSARLLTGDVVALALMLVGLLAWVERARLATIAFTLAALAKDVFLLTPVGMATGKRWRAAVVPALALLAWSIWVGTRVEGGLSPGENFAVPFSGMVEAIPNWALVGPGDLFYLVTSLATVAAGIVVCMRNRTTWLYGPILMWTVLAIVSSSAVWDFGNNAMRAFGPLLVLVALSIVRFEDEDGSDPALWRIVLSRVRLPRVGRG